MRFLNWKKLFLPYKMLESTTGEGHNEKNNCEKL